MCWAQSSHTRPWDTPAWSQHRALSPVFPAAAGTCWCGNREANVFADRSAAGAASGRKPRCGRRGRDAVTHRDGRGRTDAETEYSQEAPGGAPFAGLINQGLSCYLNALLQCLFLTPEFRDRIQEKPWASQPEQALGQIFRGLQRRCGPVPTNALTTCLGLHGGTSTLCQAGFRDSAKEKCPLHTLEGSVQRDVAEVFLLLLQHLGRDELQEVFQSEVEKIIQCLVCGHEERIPSGGRMLILPLASHTQLCGLEGAGQKPGKPANPSSGVSQDTEMLSFSLIQNFDDEDNRFFCEPCHAKTPASEETRFLRLPKVLILQVRELTFENGRFHKIQKPINIAQVLKLHTSPRELTLPKCKASHSGTLTLNPEERVYHLYAMCCHSGDCSGGHYTALAQPPGRAEWFRFNDQQVHCVGQEFPLHHTFRSETPYLLLYRCQETGDRCVPVWSRGWQEPEAPGPDNGDTRTMTDVAVPKEKLPCPGVEGETLKTDSATVCWGGHSQSLSLLQEDERICHRQSPAKKYRRDVEPGLGDKGRASEHVDEEGPKAPPPGEQGEARGLPCGPQCSPEEELPAMGMRSSAAEDQALSHPAQGPAQPGKTPQPAVLEEMQGSDTSEPGGRRGSRGLRSKDGGAEAAREGVWLLGEREAEAMATRERGVEIAKEGGQLLRDGGLEAVASREGGGEAVAAREGGWLFRERGVEAGTDRERKGEAMAAKGGAETMAAREGGGETMAAREGGGETMAAREGGAETMAARGGAETMAAREGGGETMAAREGGAETMAARGGAETMAARGGAEAVAAREGGAETMAAREGGAETMAAREGGAEAVAAREGGGETMAAREGGAEAVAAREGGAEAVAAREGGGETMAAREGGAETMAAREGGAEAVAAREGGGEAMATKEGRGEAVAAREGGAEAMATREGAAETMAAREGGTEAVAAREGGAEAMAAREGGAEAMAAREGGAETMTVRERGAEAMATRGGGAEAAATRERGGEALATREGRGEAVAAREGGAEAVATRERGREAVATREGRGEAVAAREGGAETMATREGGGETMAAREGGGEAVAAREGGAETMATREGGAETMAAREGGAEAMAAKEGGAETMTVRERGAEAMATRERGGEAVATRERGGEAVATREWGWILRDRGVEAMTTREKEGDAMASREGGAEAVATREGGAEAMAAREGGAEAMAAREGGAEAMAAREGGEEAMATREGGEEAVATREGAAEAIATREGCPSEMEEGRCQASSPKPRPGGLRDGESLMRPRARQQQKGCWLPSSGGCPPGLCLPRSKTGGGKAPGERQPWQCHTTPGSAPSQRPWGPWSLERDEE
ncbi:translation initiation factor IF-2-like isoform X12 [Trachypithecus francoisi]|uniref:translation initiation factor IF-2-like isoform X12 n=1 Tax=Trachypithecus francoisi TaxID=54180 RepID=UPI00141BF435|nr:translation initiation factor IF-2-like isoform X12 [Trachypithecus francoisi]